MPPDFNTPVCQHSSHKGQAVPAIFRLEHTTNGLIYYCDKHPQVLFFLTEVAEWTATSINQHTQPAQERG